MGKRKTLLGGLPKPGHARSVCFGSFAIEEVRPNPARVGARPGRGHSAAHAAAHAAAHDAVATAKRSVVIINYACQISNAEMW